MLKYVMWFIGLSKSQFPNTNSEKYAKWKQINGYSIVKNLKRLKHQT